MDTGHWTKFEAYSVTVSAHIPHGIKYSFTLHEKKINGLSASTMPMQSSLNGKNMVQEK